MSKTMSASEYAVEEFFRSLSDRDVSIARTVLSEGVNLTIPYALAGGTDPERVFKGKNAVLDYLSMVLKNFTHSVIADRQTFLTDDGRTVFTECRGDLIRQSNGEPYQNLYVFRFTIADGQITDIREYGNPVIYAKALGLKIG